MVRTRLALLAVLAALGLVSGCANTSGSSLWNRITHPFRRNTDACEITGIPVGEGPILEDCPPGAAPPGIPLLGGTSALTPQATVPPLAPTPRLAPTPNSQPTPYQP